MPCENSTCSFLRHYKGNGKLKYSLATSIQTKKRRRKATSLSTCMAVCSWYVYWIKLSRSIIAWNEQNNKMNPPKIGDETFIQANLKLKSPGLRFRVLLSTRETCVWPPLQPSQLCCSWHENKYANIFVTGSRIDWAKKNETGKSERSKKEPNNCNLDFWATL